MRLKYYAAQMSLMSAFSKVGIKLKEQQQLPIFYFFNIFFFLHFPPGDNMHSQHVDDDRNFTEETVVCSVVVRPKFTYEFPLMFG